MAKVRASVTGTKVMTGKVRTSFPRLFTPAPPADNPEGDKKYSVLLLIPKSDKETIAAIRQAQKAALEEGKQTKFGGKVPTTWESTLHDCDEEDDLEQYPEREGHYRISVSANENYPPGIVDAQRQPILDQTELYSGCYVRVSMVAYPYKYANKKGVSFGLRNVQKLADGEPLGGGGLAAEDEFDAVEEDEDDVL